MIDPNIILQSQTPLQLQGQAMNLQQMGQNYALGRQNLQAVQLENQQRQMQLQQTQALNDAYRQALVPGTPSGAGVSGAGPGGGSTAPSIDSSKLAGALAASGAGSRIPEVLKGVTEFQKATADLAASKTKVATDQADYAGTIGATLQKANYDPRLFLTLGQHAIDAQAVDSGAVGPVLNQVAQALQQDPTGASAQALVQQVADRFVAQSPAQQKLIAAQTAANARQQTANATTAKTNAELPGVQADASSKVRQNASAQLGAAKTQADYTAVWNALPAGVARNFPTPEQFDPATTPEAVLRAGMTPDQQVTTGQAAANAGETARHNSAIESNNATRTGIEGRRNAREQALFNQAQSTGPGGLPLPNSTAGAIANYQIPAPSARSLATPAGQALMRQVLTANPQYDGTQFATIAGARRAFTTGAQGQASVAINTAIGHADLAYQMGQALHNGTFRPGTALYNAVASAFGSDAVNNYKLVTNFVAGEVAKATAGTHPGEGDRNALGALYSANASPQQITGALGTTIQILGSKAKALDDSYRGAVGPTRAGDNFSVISNESRQVLARHGFDPGTMKPVSATPASAAGPQGTVAVTDPRGGVHTFPDQASAAKFKKLAGIQ